MPEAAGLLMLALKTWSPPPVSNTSPILNTNLLTQSLSCSFSLHISNLRVHHPSHSRSPSQHPALDPRSPPAHGRSTTSAQAGQAGTEPWSWWSAHVRQPVHSTHSSSSFSPFCQHTTCSLLPKTTFSAPRTAWSSFSILFAFSNTLLLYRGSRNPQSRYFVQE